MRDLGLKLLLGAGFSLVLAGAAQAGGFSRGNADTDLIYEDGNFNMRSSVTYVSPHREFSKNPNPALVGTNYTEDYVIPSAAIKFNLRDNLRCVGTHVQNVGGSTRYKEATVNYKLMEDFSAYESAATCGVSFDVGRGRLWLLGGGFIENLDYHREDDYSRVDIGGGTIVNFGDATLDVGGQKYGYRVGAAYEIPEIALRGQIMYRSGTDYGAEGEANAPRGVLFLALRKQGVPDAFNPFAGGNPFEKTPIAAEGTGRLPQSVELKFQTGFAPGWLGFGAVKWTDWSTMTSLQVLSVQGGFPITTNEYYWRDGWTVTGGVAHKFNDTVSGLVSLTWDRGVSTGWDLMGDSYTLATGATLKDKLGGELRAGLGFTYLSSIAETRHGADPNKTDFGDQAVKAGYAISLNLGYNIKW